MLPTILATLTSRPSPIPRATILDMVQDMYQETCTRHPISVIRSTSQHTILTAAGAEAGAGAGAGVGTTDSHPLSSYAFRNSSSLESCFDAVPPCTG